MKPFATWFFLKKIKDTLGVYGILNTVKQTNQPTNNLAIRDEACYSG